MRTIAGHQRKTAAQRARLKPRQMTPPASRLMASGKFPMKPVRNCFSTRFQGTPEAVRVGGVVSAMDAVLAEGNSARYLRGQLGDFDRDLQMVQVPNDKRVGFGNGARLQRDASLQPVTGEHSWCAKCKQHGLLFPLHGEKGGPMVCLTCRGAWHAEHGKRRNRGRVVIRAIKAFIDGGGPIKDIDKLKFAAIGHDWFGDAADSLGYMDGAAKISNEIIELTSELSNEAIALTHPAGERRRSFARAVRPSKASGGKMRAIALMPADNGLTGRSRLPRSESIRRR